MLCLLASQPQQKGFSPSNVLAGTSNGSPPPMDQDLLHLHTVHQKTRDTSTAKGMTTIAKTACLQEQKELLKPVVHLGIRAGQQAIVRLNPESSQDIARAIERSL